MSTRGCAVGMSSGESGMKSYLHPSKSYSCTNLRVVVVALKCFDGGSGPRGGRATPGCSREVRCDGNGDSSRTQRGFQD